MCDGIPAPAALCAVNGEDDMRVLRRLDVREGETGVGGRIDTTIGVVVDVETSGLGDEDVIIELALRRFRADARWLGLFQACCLNFDKALCALFGDRLTLSHDLAFALQFAKLDFDQVTALNRYEIPGDIDAVDARLREGVTDAQAADLEYQFRVVYTLDAVTKSRAHFQFVQPDSAEGKDIRNVLVQHKLADHLYPHKPGDVVRKVVAATNVPFSQHNHTQAWRKFAARPRSGAAQPENTNRDFCIYHAAHGDYTFSDQWVHKLIAVWSDPQERAALKAVRL